MRAATEAQPHSGITPGGYAEAISGLSSVIEIQAFIMREQPGINKRFAERSARKLKMMRTPRDFYEALRVLGIHTDTTARQAEHRATCRKPECDTCGRTLERTH